ncbi:MAG: hypothetical protein FLDDKLPJ_01553 [Phycisphaerae bacterium]|nr:hypothetical protein [Phycisphaerae bacterium]
MSILDRYILRMLAFNYVVSLGVMIGLYVVMDLFVNLDEFTEHGPSVGVLLRNIADYYLPGLLLYFSQLSGVITLFACVMTVARMRHFNELTAILASGVSLYRVAAPILVFGALTTSLLVVDTEVLIPRVAHLLARRHDEVGTLRGYSVALMRDADGTLLSGLEFIPAAGELRRLVALSRDEEGALSRLVEADTATWEAIPGHPHGGRWKLNRGRERAVEKADASLPGPRGRQTLAQIHWLETSLDPPSIQLRQSEQWIRYLSLTQLRALEGSSPPNLAQVQQAGHVRVTTPIVNLVLLLLGLPFFLNRSPLYILRDATWCLACCGTCYAATFTCQSILPGVNSALPAWLPIIVFGPVAMVLMDRVRT